MTTILDAYALVAFLRDEPAAEEVEQLLRRGDCAISSVNLAETVDQMIRRRKTPVSHLEMTLAAVIQGTGLNVLPFHELTSIRTGRLRADHYNRSSSPLSLADCALLATAATLPGSVIATSDRAVLAAALAEGIDAVRMDSS